MIKKAYCLFEQSGTFKNEFIKLGIPAADYDILNEFNQTDFICNLFSEIENAYNDKPSLFDKIEKDDIVLAFFPCVRFETKINLYFQGQNFAQRNWTDIHKLEYDIKLHNELNEMYNLICKLFIICIKKDIKLIVENPHMVDHYLVRYFPIKAKLIDTNRMIDGDFFKKPTQYWFINCEPKFNLLFEPITYKKQKIVAYTSNKAERSLISKEYANRFIRQYLMDE